MISASLNHVAHGIRQRIEQKSRIRLKEKILEDGKLSLKEANQWYRKGGGETLEVDASKVDLNFLNSDDFTIGKTKPVQTLGRSRDGLVYGNITITYEGNNQFSIKPDFYNFEMHSGGGFKTWFRNVATRVGSWNAGKGTSYKIIFNGLNTPN